MTAGTAARTHWPALDGLRGVAALAVVVFHANVAGLGVNGYAGVDVFFALSGFLITSLLLGEHARNGRIALRRFYIRRGLRLYPALVATCALVLGFAVVGGAVGEVLPAILAALFYVANWWVYTGGHAPMLEHTWTLAIEEHFYVVWPLLVVGFLSRRRALRLVAAGLGVALMVLLLVPWAESIDGVRHSYLRGTPIIWGSLLAVATHRGLLRGGGKVLEVLGLIATVALTLLLVVPWEAPSFWMTEYRSVPGLLSVFVVAVVVLAPHGVRWMAWAPLLWAGRRSYGIYLYHFPVLSLLRHQIDIGPLELRIAVGMVLTLVIAGVSYRFVEAPFLRMKSRYSAG